MGYIPPTIPYGSNVANPKLKDLLDGLQQNIMMNMNCHAVGTVQSFSQGMLNGSPNNLYTVTVKVNYSKTYFEKQADNSILAVQKPYPLLVDCPLVILGGFSTHLTFPVSQGDWCLVLFNDRDLNNWYAGNTSGPVATPRLHSLSDGIALVGFPVVGTYNQDYALLSNGVAEVGMQTTGGRVRIANQVTTLNTLIGDLITAIEGLVIDVGGLPVGSVDPSSVAQLQAIATQFTTLLE